MKGNQQERKCSKEDFADLEWLSPAEAAVWLGISRNALYEAIKKEQVPGVLRIGRRILINKQALIDASTAGNGSREA